MPAQGGRPFATGWTAPSPLHAAAAERTWPLTNCYIDLWIELLHAWGLDPIAALAFTVTQDWDGDQFTFYKFPTADLETLYGVRVEELALYDHLERHVAVQTARGRVVLIEVDGFHLPDTRATSYGRDHSKTTIGIDGIDIPAGRCTYFHNAGRHELTGDDYAAILRIPRRNGLPFFPYAEVARFTGAPAPHPLLRAQARALLAAHLLRRPAGNPIAAFRDAFPAALDQLIARGPEFFHLYAFNTFRQLGSAHELLGSFLAWLDPESLAEAASCCAAISDGAKALQFRTARLVARRRRDGCEDLLGTLCEARARLHAILDREDAAWRHRQPGPASAPPGPPGMTADAA